MGLTRWKFYKVHHTTLGPVVVGAKGNLRCLTWSKWTTRYFVGFAWISYTDQQNFTLFKATPVPLIYVLLKMRDMTDALIGHEKRERELADVTL